MPASMDTRVKEQLLKQWLAGDSRDKIAADIAIGAGTVTNIVNEWRNRIDDSEFDAIRDLAVSLKKQGIGLSGLANRVRLYNFVKKLGAEDHQVESLIANLLNGARCLSNDKTIDLVNQLYEFTKSETILPTEVPAYVKEKLEEKKRLEEEIQKSGAVLEEKNVDIQTINEYKALKDELKKYDLSTEKPRSLVSVLQTVNQIGYDAHKIITNLVHLKSFKQTERRLKNNCKMWESRVARYRQVLPLCQQITRLGIGIEELMAYHSAVLKRADEDGIPLGAAPYRVMTDIDSYNRLGGVQKKLNETIMNMQLVDLVSAHRNAAANTVMRLFSLGITEGQILEACKYIESNGRNSSPYPNFHFR